MSKRLKSYKKKASKLIGGDTSYYCVLLAVAVIIGMGIANMNGVTIIHIPGEDTTIYEYVTETVTVTEPLEGNWYYLKVSFTWTDLVVIEDERDIWIGISTPALVGLDDHTFDAAEENTWYTFSDFRFEEGYTVKLGMMSMVPTPPSYETFEDYNDVMAQQLSGQIPFYRSDYMPPGGVDDPLYTAGYIMWTWELA